MAELGIADLLRTGARDSNELAQSTQSHPQTLYRVLRFLAAQDILSEVAPGRFALTTLGAPLRSDVTGSLRPVFRYLLNDFHWQPCGRLLETCAQERRHSGWSMGSEGQVLAAILKRYPHRRGILFDRPVAMSTAQAL